jgi:polyphosphate kinase 2 (PPK2 family)
MLESVDLSLKLDKETYAKELDAQQFRLLRLEQKMRKAGLPVIVLYEGWDASGKGGSILRITQKLDPRGVRVWPIAAPTELELRYPYLWRFWTRLPARGELAIFDRSWYGRVLVERVEKYAKKVAWQRAYDEIRHFERLLTDDGTVLIKFWMHISKDEQMRRFKEREANPFKSWKIGPEDWRNREKWDKYVEAAEEMFRETHTDNAPWHLIAAENKPYARVTTVRIVADAIEQALG